MSCVSSKSLVLVCGCDDDLCPNRGSNNVLSKMAPFLIKLRTCLPTLVRPRASLLLCTGLTIQLILGSRRTCASLLAVTEERRITYSFVVRIHQDDFIILVDSVLVYPIRVEDSQVSASPSHSLLCNTPVTALRFEVIYTLANRFTVGSTYQPPGY